jgi:hypothetical protein
MATTSVEDRLRVLVAATQLTQPLGAITKQAGE